MATQEHPQAMFERLQATRLPLATALTDAAIKQGRTNNQRHPDRTHKQPMRWYCASPECRVNGERFEFTSEYPRCPKCSAEEYPYVLTLALIHLLVRDPKGPIPSMGHRLRIACDTAGARAYIATKTNDEAGHGTLELVNCPGCLEWARKNNYTGPQTVTAVATA